MTFKEFTCLVVVVVGFLYFHNVDAGEFYGNVGIGMYEGASTSWSHVYDGYSYDINNPIGLAEGGYRFDNDVELFVLHLSSLQQQDNGFTGLFIRKQLF